jgi:hypothetical protein
MAACLGNTPTTRASSSYIELERLVTGLPKNSVSSQRAGIAQQGANPISRCIRSDASGATITTVKKQPASFTRRKLSSVVRKAITSYYAEQEQVEVARAAKQQNVSMSSFVASAALKEARRLNRK